MINQYISHEQRTVLSVLAGSAAKAGCKLLEVGSWVGDSTLVLADVAKKNGGHLFCIDWWNGSVGTDLTEIAAKSDVFSLFWERICREGFENTVIPIRSRSEIAANILKKYLFDLVFIDADHRYESLLADIKHYAPLVKKSGGILCGHDCEGRIADFDRTFLESGKGMDVQESVHCGVVLGVGITFKDYSVDHGIWSVKKGLMGWRPTALKFEHLVSRRQPLPAPLGSTANYDLYRYGDSVYAVPKGLRAFDLANEESRNQPQIKKENSIEGVTELVGETITSTDYPVLVDVYMGFNFVRYKKRIYGMDQTLGDMDLGSLKESELKKYQGMNSCVIAETVEEAKLMVLGIKNVLLENSLKEQEELIKVLKAKISSGQHD